jgi:lipopolysaccharide transport system permease protein
MAWRYVGARDADAALHVRLFGVVRHWRLLRRMAQRDLQQRYVGSALGFAWAVINPLLFVAVYAAIFTFVFKGRLSPQAPTEQYALYVVTGLLPWVAFSEVATRSTQTMGEHRNLVKFVVFPVQILPLTSLYTTAFSQGVGLAACLVLAAVLRGGLDGAIFLLVPALLVQTVFLAGVAWLLGAVGAVFRDVKELVAVALMVGMFLTPIFYLEQELPRAFRVLVELNPLTHLIRVYRAAFLDLGGGYESSLAIFTVLAGAALLGGFLAFERTRVFLSDIL